MPKNILLPLAIVYTLLLLVATFMNPSGVPKLTFSHYDKLYHLVAYFLLGFAWVSVARFKGDAQRMYVVVLLLICFGIVLEILQHKVNPLRHFEIQDMIANILGILFGTLIAVKQNIITFN